MRNPIFTLAAGLLSAGFCWLTAATAGPLPTFDSFRQIDRTRRLTGQLQTAELLKATRLDPELINGVVRQGTNDAHLAWGAAELLADWSQRRIQFESALATTGTNKLIALRFACAAARQREYDLALQWARYCKDKDPDNLVPWVVESWVLIERKQRSQLPQTLPVWVTHYRDYTVDVCEMRFMVLERAGYSPYVARRLGFKPDSDALLMASELGRPPVEEMLRLLLKQTADSLQLRRQFLVNELVGQTLERTLYALHTDLEMQTVVQSRKEAIAVRREELKGLLVDMERNIVEAASESQLVQYYDNILAFGEEEAMHKLMATVRAPAPAVSAPTGN